MSKFIDLTGKQFSSLTVICKAENNRQGNICWLCRCECGVEKVISGNHLARKIYPVKSCGCQARKIGSRNSLWKGCGEISGNWWYNHILRERNPKKRAKIPVDITVEYAWELFLKQNRKCALSGLELQIGTAKSTTCTASIDRIDSGLGYVKENIQWVHKHINFMKRTYSQEYFIQMCKLVSVNCAGGACTIV